jgi:hypothetical protein
MKHSIALIAILALVQGSGTLSAQTGGTCATRAATLSSGSLTEADSQARAYAGIQTCPAAIRDQAMAHALDRRRNLASFAELGAEAFAFATRDRAVFAQLVTMSGDRTASPAARAAAVMMLLTMVDTGGGHSDLDYFVKQREGDFCIAVGSPFGRRLVGGPLDPDSTRRVVAALVPLERSSSTEPAVRSAAHCALNVLRKRELGAFAMLAPFNSGDITVTYACGTFFRVRNRSRFTYLAAIRIPGVTRPVPLFIKGTDRNATNADTYYDAGARGTVQLDIDNAAAYTAASTHQKCAPGRWTP